MGAQAKTDKLIRLHRCPLHLMVKNDKNPNKMRPREFDLLCDNMNSTGWTDPILARPLDHKKLAKVFTSVGANEDAIVEAMLSGDMKVRIIGGHHRYDAASYLGFEEGPVTIIMDPDFDDDMETFQVVRMNAIHGKMDPTAFMDLLGDLPNKYADDVLQELLGFADEAEFNRLAKQMAKSLPDKATQDKFTEAAKEIKTIDGLAKLLNHMFATYGDTLPFGYMVFEYGGQKSMWLRSEAKTMKALEILGIICIDNKRTMDDVLGTVIQMMAAPEGQEFVQGVITDTPYVDIPKGMTINPTKDNLQQMYELD